MKILFLKKKGKINALEAKYVLLELEVALDQLLYNNYRYIITK